MGTPNNCEEIDDIEILKEKIIKINSIFTIIAEKEGKIRTLETKLKNASRQNIKLECRNNELLSEIETCQKEKEQKELEYSGQILEESGKYSLLEDMIENLKSSNGQAMKAMVEKLNTTNQKAKQKHIQVCKKYKRCIMVKNQQYQGSKRKYTGQIYRLRKVIKYLRTQLKGISSYESGRPFVKKELEEPKKVQILQNILIKPPEKNEEEVEIDIDALLNEMTCLPDLLSPFKEEVPEKCSIQTQTIRSSVTRPVQTDSLSTARKQTQTYIRTSNAEVQCELSSTYPLQCVKSLELRGVSKSIQTDVKKHTKQTQTTKSALKSSSSQTCGLFVEKKVTLKRAVTVLKRSRKTFTISNGKLIHYSMNPITRDTSNESLITQSVFRRLVKYIDTQYGGMDSRKRRRISNLLLETKQLERSRDLMNLIRSGMASRSGHSDTESSGYESRVLHPARHFEDLLKMEMSTPGDTGMSSEGDSGEHSLGVQAAGQVDADIESILKELMIETPRMLSPFSDEPAVEVSVEPNAVEQTEEFVEIEPEKKTRKRPVNRLAMLKRKIKKCNQVNILRTPAGDEKTEEMCLTSRKRQALNNLTETAIVDQDKAISSDETTPVESVTKDVENSDAFKSDVDKLNINKVNVNEEFQRMRQKCIRSKNTNKQQQFDEHEHSNDESTNAPEKLETTSHTPKPKLKAEDILALLNVPYESEHSYAAPYDLQCDGKARVPMQVGDSSANVEISAILETSNTVIETMEDIDSLYGPDIGANINIYSEVTREESPKITEFSITSTPKASVNKTTPDRSTRHVPGLIQMTTRSGRTLGSSPTVTDTRRVSAESPATPVTKKKRGRTRKNSATNSPAPEVNVFAKRLCMSPAAEILKTHEEACQKVVESDVLTTRSGRSFKRPVSSASKCKPLDVINTKIESPLQQQYQECPTLGICEKRKRIARTPKNPIPAICATNTNTSVKVLEGGMPKVMDLIVDNSFKKVVNTAEKLLPQATSNWNEAIPPEYKSVKESVFIPKVTIDQAISSELISDCPLPKVIETKKETTSKSERPLNSEPHEDNDDDSKSEVGTDNAKVKPGKKMLFKTFKTHFDKCVWYRGDSRICHDEVEAFKSMRVGKLANFTIQYLKNDQGDLDKPKTPTMMEPLLTIKQKVVIGLMVRIERELKSNDYSTYMISETERHLLYNEQREPEMLENMSRFYTALCRLQQKKHQVRVFLGDLLYINPTHKFVIIFTIITSWLNLLTPYSENSSGVGIDRVLAYVTMVQPNEPPAKTNANSAHDNCIGVLKNLLVTYYKYPREEQCVNDLMMSLLESYMCGGHVQFEAAILVLCCYGSPQWTYDKVQLISELCKVSTDEECVRNLNRLMTNIARRMTPEFQAKVHQHLDEVTAHLQNGKQSININLETVCDS